MAYISKQYGGLVVKPDKRKEDSVTSSSLEKPSYTITEGNFFLFHYGSLGSRSKENKSIVSEVVIEEKNEHGVVKRKKWKVKGDIELGYPTWFDEKVFIAVIDCAKRYNYPVQNPVPVNISEICRIMDISPQHGKNRNMVRESLERIASVTITTEDTFYHKEKEAHIQDTFPYFQRVQTARAKTKGEEASQTKVWLNDYVLSNVNNGYIRLIDTTFFMSLSPIAGRLVEILSSKIFGLFRASQRGIDQPYITYDYDKLCEHMPLREYQYYSRAAQQLESAHKQLVDKQYLEAVEWPKRSEWPDNKTIRYYPGEKAKYDFNNAIKEVSKQIELPFYSAKSTTTLPSEDNLPDNAYAYVEILRKRGVSDKQALQVTKKHTEETITWAGIEHPVIDFYCQWYDWQLEHGGEKKPESGAWLYSAINEGWMPPREFQTKKQKQAIKQKQEKSKELKEEQDKQRKEKHLKEQYFEWLNKSAERRWEEQRFWFKYEFKKEHGHEPTPEEIEKARDEYLADPETPEEYQKRRFGEVKYPLSTSEE